RRGAWSWISQQRQEFSSYERTSVNERAGSILHSATSSVRSTAPITFSVFSSTPIDTSPKRLGASIDVSNSMPWCLACWAPPRVAPRGPSAAYALFPFWPTEQWRSQEPMLFCASCKRGRGLHRKTDKDGLDREA